MTHLELSQKLGVSRVYITEIINRTARPSSRLALKLEEVTGIDRRAWLWPDEFKNPMIKKSSARVGRRPDPPSASGPESGE